MPYHGKILIGLTGNIACGKSTVLARLAALGAYTIDADRLIHDMLKKGGIAYEPVVREFGDAILGDDGEIDRRKLGMIVFSDPAKLASLEAIEHPIVRQLIDEEIISAPRPIVVLDAIKLIESGWAGKCDQVWAVTCTRDQQISRLIKTRGYSNAEAETRVAAQSPQSEKASRADVVIDNSGSKSNSYRQIDNAWEAIAPRKG